MVKTHLSPKLAILTSWWKLSLFDVFYANKVAHFLGCTAKISALSPLKPTSFSLNPPRLIILTFLKWQPLPVRAACARSFSFDATSTATLVEIKRIEPRCVLTWSAGISRHVSPDGNRNLQSFFSQIWRDPVLDSVVFIAARFLSSQSPAKLFIQVEKG